MRMSHRQVPPVKKVSHYRYHSLRQISTFPRRAPIFTAVSSILALALILTTPPSFAQSDCISSSYIPGTAPLLLQHPDGRYIHLQADSRNFQRGAHLWVNGVYEDFYFVPFTVFSADEIVVEFKQSLRSEIWMGAVRSPVIKQIPIVIACNGWFGDLP